MSTETPITDGEYDFAGRLDPLTEVVHVSVVRNLEIENTALQKALEAIRSEIDGKADADIDGPNVFMRIDTLIDAVLG